MAGAVPRFRSSCASTMRPAVNRRHRSPPTLSARAAMRRHPNPNGPRQRNRRTRNPNPKSQRRKASRARHPRHPPSPSRTSRAGSRRRGTRKLRLAKNPKPPRSPPHRQRPKRPRQRRQIPPRRLRWSLIQWLGRRPKLRPATTRLCRATIFPTDRDRDAPAAPIRLGVFRWRGGFRLFGAFFRWVRRFAGSRFKERFGGNDRGFLLGRVTSLRYIPAARDAPCFVFVARDDKTDRNFHLGVERDRYLMLADRLDRRVHRNLIAVKAKPGIAN